MQRDKNLWFLHAEKAPMWNLFPAYLNVTQKKEQRIKRANPELYI